MKKVEFNKENIRKVELAKNFRNGGLEEFVEDFATSDEPALEVGYTQYSKSSSCAWTLSQALITYSLDRLCKVYTRNYSVYLVKIEYEQEFLKAFPRQFGKKSIVTEEVEKIVEEVVKAAEIVEPINSLESRKSNRKILNEIRNFWNFGVEYENVSMRNLSSEYCERISSVLKQFGNKIAISNFVDFAELALKPEDGALLYAIQKEASKI